MRRAVYVLLGTIIILPSLIGKARASAAPDIFLTEIQTGSSDSASQEFIELYNNTDETIDFGDIANGGQTVWQLQYFSSTSVGQPDFSWQNEPSGSIELTGAIPAHDYYILSSAPDGVGYWPGDVEPDQTYSSPHLASTAGGLQLVDVAGDTITAHDNIAWSDSDARSSEQYEPPKAGGSLQRMVDDDNNYLDDNGDLYAWVPATTISPDDNWSSSSEPVDQPNPSDGSTDTTSNQGPETLEITELLPNPASPASDATDEFVEIYNYGGQPVNLEGFTIQTGANYSYSYPITNASLASRSYTIFTSGDTPLSLSNSGGQARLLNPAGQVIDETAGYDEADEGEAWALIGQEWQWTATPTPGATNVLHAPVVKTKTKKAKTSKTKKKATKASKAKKAKGILGAASSDGTPTGGDQAPALHPAVLAGVGGAALLYGAYEYRTDVANRLYQLRRYRAARRAARAAAKGA